MSANNYFNQHEALIKHHTHIYMHVHVYRNFLVYEFPTNYAALFIPTKYFFILYGII